jgi:predicted phage tail protein
MPLIGLFGTLTVVTVVTLWVLLKAASTQLQADAADVESNVPSVLFERAVSIFQTIVAAALLAEFWSGLAAWAGGAWHWILINVA